MDALTVPRAALANLVAVVEAEVDVFNRSPVFRSHLDQAKAHLRKALAPPTVQQAAQALADAAGREIIHDCTRYSPKVAKAQAVDF